jgi:hypothetical protein
LLSAYDAIAKYWRIGDLLGELAVGFIVYPVVVPALALCGGAHDRCASALGRTAQLFALGLTVCWAIIGWRVALSTARRWVRRFRAVGS